MRTVGIGVIAVAAAVAGCTASTSTEQAMQPAAGAEPLTYEARTMTEFDAARDQASEWCHTYRLERARYVDRTLETARFECVPW